jgi:hypothetical protein
MDDATSSFPVLALPFAVGGKGQGRWGAGVSLFDVLGSWARRFSSLFEGSGQERTAEGAGMGVLVEILGSQGRQPREVGPTYLSLFDVLGSCGRRGKATASRRRAKGAVDTMSRGEGMGEKPLVGDLVVIVLLKIVLSSGFAVWFRKTG